MFNVSWSSSVYLGDAGISDFPLSAFSVFSSIAMMLVEVLIFGVTSSRNRCIFITWCASVIGPRLYQWSVRLNVSHCFVVVA